MRKLVVILVLIGCATVGFFGVKRRFDVLRSPERRAWKDQAVLAIATDLKDPDHLKKRFGKVPGPRGEWDTSEPEWLTSDTIVCRDGSWLAYRSQCHKQDQKIEDIFVAKASDGRWYYSDFHFCINAVVLEMNGQPESLERFNADYRLAEFDGRSDVDLGSTRGR